MNFLVTGGCGYIGTQLTKHLLSKNNKVTVVDNCWFGNFHNNMEGMETGNDLWEQSGGDAKDALEAVGSCTNPEIFQGLVFYDPTKPDFS